MIFEYKQVDICPNMQHVLCNKQLIGTGTTLKHFFGSLNLNNIQYKIVVDEDGQIVVKENENVVGKIKQKIQKLNVRKFFDNTISYYEFCIADRVLEIIPICFSKRDYNFYQVEENGKTVGMIQKIDKVVNYKHQYICYSDTEELLPYVAVWCLFLQSTKYYPFMVSGEGNVVQRRIGSSAKHVREKYDATFIPKIKVLEGIE